MRIVGPHIAAAGIGYDTRHITLTAGYIPSAVFRPIHHHQRPLLFRLTRLRRLLNFTVGVFFCLEKAIRRRTAPNQTAVEAHPFGATEGRTFHVVGATHRRYAQSFDHRGALVGKRRIPPRIDAGRFHTFDIRRSARTEISKSFALQSWRNDKSRLTNACQTVGRTESQEQSGVHRTLWQHAAARHFDHRAARRHIGGGAAGHQSILGAHRRTVPRIEHRGQFVTAACFQAQESRMAQTSFCFDRRRASHAQPQATHSRPCGTQPRLHSVPIVTSPANEVFIRSLILSRSVSWPSRNMSFVTTASTVMSRPLSTPASMSRNEVS